MLEKSKNMASWSGVRELLLSFPFCDDLMLMGGLAGGCVLFCADSGCGHTLHKTGIFFSF